MGEREQASQVPQINGTVLAGQNENEALPQPAGLHVGALVLEKSFGAGTYEHVPAGVGETN